MADGTSPWLVGGWSTLIPGRGGQLGRVIQTKTAPPAEEKIDWPQRPEVRGKLVRVRILKGEVGHFQAYEPGDVIDLAEADAKPRLRDGRARLARPDEPLTSAGIV